MDNFVQTVGGSFIYCLQTDDKFKHFVDPVDLVKYINEELTGDENIINVWTLKREADIGLTAQARYIQQRRNEIGPANES